MELRSSASVSDVGPLKLLVSHSVMDFKGLTGSVAGLCMCMLTTLVTKGDGIRGMVS